MAYKAALLQPRVDVGLDLDDPGEGHKLALSIAFDARHIGMRNVTFETSQRSKRRSPRSDVGQPANI